MPLHGSIDSSRDRGAAKRGERHDAAEPAFAGAGRAQAHGEGSATGTPRRGGTTAIRRAAEGGRSSLYAGSPRLHTAVSPLRGWRLLLSSCARHVGRGTQVAVEARELKVAAAEAEKREKQEVNAARQLLIQFYRKVGGSNYGCA
jgi:hypothetical protein